MRRLSWRPVSNIIGIRRGYYQAPDGREDAIVAEAASSRSAKLIRPT